MKFEINYKVYEVSKAYRNGKLIKKFNTLTQAEKYTKQSIYRFCLTGLIINMVKESNATGDQLRLMLDEFENQSCNF